MFFIKKVAVYSLISMLYVLPLHAQINIKRANSKEMYVTYYKSDTGKIYFIDPGFYMAKKVKGRNLEYILRRDMYHLIDDTLKIFLTDETRPELFGGYRSLDSASLMAGFSKIDSLSSTNFRNYCIIFPRKLNYNYLIVYYCYSYNMTDLFDKSKRRSFYFVK